MTDLPSNQNDNPNPGKKTVPDLHAGIGRDKPPQKTIKVPKGHLKVTITFMEQLSKPEGQPVKPPHNRKIAFMRAEQPTLSFYRYLYDTVGEPWLWSDRRRMARHVLRETITDERVDLLVLYSAGVPAGFAEIDRRSWPVIDLAYFGLIPDFIGQGLGNFMLDAALRHAWTFQPEKLTVNTCTFDHPRAISTYQKAGFEPVHQATKVIRDPRLTGHLPETAAPHIPLAAT